MTPFEWVSLVLAAFTAILIPTIVLLLRITVKWTRVEAQLKEVAEDIAQLVKEKDKVHEAILGQIRDDRNATNRRLRWLEEHLWKGERRAV